MTIAGDMDVIVNFDKPAHERVKDIFDFLTEADVIHYLWHEHTREEVSNFLECIDTLKKKCAW